MHRTLLRSKIHRATVTDADLEYIGSMTLDPDLMDAAHLVVHEKVEILNITNGERFATYVIEGERGSGDVVLNGAAAHKASRGDLVIVCCYAELDESEIADHEPHVVFVDRDNKVVSKERAVIAHRQPLPMPQAV